MSIFSFCRGTEKRKEKKIPGSRECYFYPGVRCISVEIAWGLGACASGEPALPPLSTSAEGVRLPCGSLIPPLNSPTPSIGFWRNGPRDGAQACDSQEPEGHTCGDRASRGDTFCVAVLVCCVGVSPCSSTYLWPCEPGRSLRLSPCFLMKMLPPVVQCWCSGTTEPRISTRQSGRSPF